MTMLLMGRRATMSRLPRPTTITYCAAKNSTMSRSLITLFVVLIISHDITAARGLTPPPLAKTTEHLPLARKAMEFIDASSDPFHAVQSSIDLLKTKGFVELKDGEPFRGKLEVGGKYYYTRNKSTLVAFCIGKLLQGNVPFGFKVIGGHTDSPNLRVKPRSKRTASGCAQIGVECYGGGLWHTWFDRDLGLSGRVLVRRNDDNSAIQQRLVKIDRALLRISNLAIHLQTAKEREAFVVNKEDHLSPILALAAAKALNNNNPNEGDDNSNTDDDKSASKEDETKSGNSDSSEKKVKDGWTEHQEPALLQVLAHELGVDTADICDFELNLFDIQKASLGGAYSEFLHSSRLDNLASCFLAVQALLEHVGNNDDEPSKLDVDSDVSVIVLYDHEEVGSSSAVGAASPILSEAVKRISAALHTGSEASNNNGDDWYEGCIRKSFVLSSDQAHALHPNYANKHEKMHQPKLNGGMVIKRNSNQRYATNTITGFVIREIARRANIKPPQEFMVRQDCGCGSTIGPLISAATGIRAVDMGCPQLSMHSIRETMGVCDLTNGLELFKAFFEHFRPVDDSIEQ